MEISVTERKDKEIAILYFIFILPVRLLPRWFSPQRPHTLIGTTGTKYLCSAGEALVRSGQSCFCFPRCDNSFITWQLVAITSARTFLFSFTLSAILCSL